MSYIKFATLFTLSLGSLLGGTISLTSGTLLVDAVTLNFPITGTIHQYTRSGADLGSTPVTGTGDIVEGLAVLGGQLFVSDGAGGVSRVDTATGIAQSVFTTPSVGLEGIASFQGSLATLSFNANSINVYSISGVLQQSIHLVSTPTSFSWSGLAWDGNTFFLPDYQSGRIYEYSPTGIQLGILDTKLGQFGLGGISYDLSNGSLWIAGLASSTLFDIAKDGSVLNQFATSFRPGGGIAVVSASELNTPEPSFAFITGSAVLLLALISRAIHVRVCPRGVAEHG